MVIFDKVDERIKTCQIASDNILGGKMAASYVLSKKLDQILLVIGKDVSVSQKRVQGFLAEINSHGYSYQELVCFGLDAPDKLFADLLMFFMERIRYLDFTSVFTTTDTLTLTVLRVFKKLDIQLPVIGFCNSELSDLLYGEPVTIVQPSSEIGKLASEKLYSAIKYKIAPDEEMLFLPTTIVGRL